MPLTRLVDPQVLIEGGRNTTRCVHFVHPDGRLIPVETYNLFYRDGLEAARLGPLRLQARATAPGQWPPADSLRRRGGTGSTSP